MSRKTTPGTEKRALNIKEYKLTPRLKGTKQETAPTAQIAPTPPTILVKSDLTKLPLNLNMRRANINIIARKI